MQIDTTSYSKNLAINLLQELLAATNPNATLIMDSAVMEHQFAILDDYERGFRRICIAIPRIDGIQQWIDHVRSLAMGYYKYHYNFEGTMVEVAKPTEKAIELRVSVGEGKKEFLCKLKFIPEYHTDWYKHMCLPPVKMMAKFLNERTKALGLVGAVGLRSVQVESLGQLVRYYVGTVSYSTLAGDITILADIGFVLKHVDLMPPQINYMRNYFKYIKKAVNRWEWITYFENGYTNRLEANTRINELGDAWKKSRSIMVNPKASVRDALSTLVKFMIPLMKPESFGDSKDIGWISGGYSAC